MSLAEGLRQRDRETRCSRSAEQNRVQTDGSEETQTAVRGKAARLPLWLWAD